VIVIGSGRRLYRQYLLEGAAGRRPLWLIDEVPATWQRPFVVGDSAVAMLDHDRSDPDEQGIADATVAVSRNRPISGVFTYDEGLVMAAARLAERFGLPGATVAGADACRDKSRTRAALTAAGLPQPRFELVHTLTEAAAAAGRFGYPVVLKPRGLGASMGVVRAAGEAELATAFGVADRAGSGGPSSYADGVLVEELVAGPEISVDGTVRSGEYRPFFVARKQLGPEPYFEEVGHTVNGADPLLRDAALWCVLAEAHRVLGFRDGITHTEVRLSDRGPVIIEVNARLGGDLIPYLGQLATGIEPGRVAVDVATGTEPDLQPIRQTCAGIRFLYPPEDCRVVDISVPSPDEVPGLLTARAMVEPGATVQLPPRAHIDRYAYVICVDDDPATCARRLDEAAALVSLTYEALVPAP